MGGENVRIRAWLGITVPKWYAPAISRVANAKCAVYTGVAR